MNIAIFASGSGTNAENIIQYFEHHPYIRIKCVLSNKKDAYVLERAKKYAINTKIFDKKIFCETEAIVDYLAQEKIDFIILAGFLWLIPSYLIKAFPKKIINIHPALLPKYGGKGMYGMNVHKAVFENQEKISGITIHYASEIYDEGEVIFQASCTLTSEDTPERIAQKIHELEYEHFPKIIEKIIMKIP
jgi:phosphoribosylglycinamide formyltransferase 1